ncbi:MAG: DUF2793 domain-containing protein [Erythrobacter sp.]
MSEPTIFTSASPKYGLPFLFAGQAQKELFVNQAHALVDALVHTSVEGSTSTPPVAPDQGQSWLIEASPTGNWPDHEGEIATFVDPEWIYVSPRAGMQVYDIGAGQMLIFDNGWSSAATPSLPSGGATVDTEARQRLATLIQEFRNLGI